MRNEGLKELSGDVREGRAIRCVLLSSKGLNQGHEGVSQMARLGWMLARLAVQGWGGLPLALEVSEHLVSFKRAGIPLVGGVDYAVLGLGKQIRWIFPK